MLQVREKGLTLKRKDRTTQEKKLWKDQNSKIYLIRTENHEHWYKYKIQQIFCVSNLHKTRKTILQELTKSRSLTLSFWKSVYPHLGKNNSKTIMLLENTSFVGNEQGIEKTINDFYKYYKKNTQNFYYLLSYYSVT